MKKLLKRIMALSLCACMMMGAASPASAATTNYTLPSNFSDLWIENPVTIKSEYNNAHKLNMLAYDFNSVTDGTDVTTWNTSANDYTQTWYIEPYDSNSFTIHPYTKTNLVLNLYRNSVMNCCLNNELGNTVADYVIRFSDETNSIYGDQFGIVLPTRGLAMSTIPSVKVSETSSVYGYQVRWLSPISANSVDPTQAWDIDIVW